MRHLFISVLTLSLMVLVAEAAWSGPPGVPTTCPTGSPGCDVPINTSINGQSKIGALVAGGLKSLTSIGIGSNFSLTSPVSAPLHVKSSPAGGLPGWIGQVLVEPSDTNDAGITLKSTRVGSQLWSIIAGSGSFTGAGNNNFRIFNGNGAGDAIDITPTNNVGIGVLTPASKLDVNGDICWTPPGGSRQCLGSGPQGSGGYWATNATGDIRNTNIDVNTGLPAQVNIKGQIKIEGGTPGNNKILVSNANGLASWKAASDIPGASGLGNDVLFTTFAGCVPGIGCPIRSGDAGPTQNHSLIDGIGTVTMTCPTDYKVVSGGADCDKSWNAIVAVQTAYLNTSRPISETQWQVQCTKLSGSYVSLITTENASAIKSASIICAK